MTRSRRAVLFAAAPMVVAIAGCSGADSPAEADTTAPESPSPTPSSEISDTAPSAGMDLDLREANVVGLSVESRGDEYRFSVSLHHDDAGEPGYANRWQVERRDGTRLRRRDLLHAHDEQPFTRSATVEIPADVTCVVVRGHDQTHGYGGRVMAVDVRTGATNAVNQGTEPRPIDSSECPSSDRQFRDVEESAGRRFA